MTHLKLTPAEEKRLADAFVAQALVMGLKGNKTLPKAVKKQGRERGCERQAAKILIPLFLVSVRGWFIGQSNTRGLRANSAKNHVSELTV